MQVREPEFRGTLTDVAAAAAALHIEANDILGTGLPIQEVSCGVPFLIVPVATRAAVDRAELDRLAMASKAPCADEIGLIGCLKWRPAWNRHLTAAAEADIIHELSGADKSAP